MKLKKLRKSLGLTQESLGAKIGCSAPAISKWERNIETIPDYIIFRIKELYGVEIEKEYNNLKVYKNKIEELEEKQFNGFYQLKLLKQNTNEEELKNGEDFKVKVILTNAPLKLIKAVLKKNKNNFEETQAQVIRSGYAMVDIPKFKIII